MGTQGMRMVWKSSKWSTARTSVLGCGQLTTASLLTRCEYRCAKIHASAPPQSWETRTGRSSPSAPISAAMSSVSVKTS